MKHPRLWVATCAAMLGATPLPSHAQKNQRLLTIYDVSAALAGLVANSPFDFVARSRISYGITGVSAYDQFFRNSAVTYGGFVFGRTLFDEATTTLKRFARSKAAVSSMREEIREITQDADTSQWTTEQSLAVLRAAKKRDELSSDERFYFLATSALVAATLPVLRASVTAAPQLARSAPPLVRGAPSAFDIFQAASVAGSVNRSAKQIHAIPREGATLLESFVVLSRGLEALASEK